MKLPREVTSGALAGATVGLALRLAIGIISLLRAQVADKAKMPPAPVPVEEHANPTLQAEIRHAPVAPSSEAKAAVETGAVKFIIRPGPDAGDATVAEILLELGAIPICQNGDTIRVWSSTANDWLPVQRSQDLNGYAIGRAWTLPHPQVLRPAATKVPPSSSIFLVLPSTEELRVVGAVEQSLSPHPLTDYGRIELILGRTRAGHVQWILSKAILHDNSELAPGLVLPI
jgi:hypothetical protein